MQEAAADYMAVIDQIKNVEPEFAPAIAYTKPRDPKTGHLVACSQIGGTIASPYLLDGWLLKPVLFESVTAPIAISIWALIAYAVGEAWANTSAERIGDVEIIIDGGKITQKATARFIMGNQWWPEVVVGNFGINTLEDQTVIDLTGLILRSHGESLKARSGRIIERLTPPEPLCSHPGWYRELWKTTIVKVGTK